MMSVYGASSTHAAGGGGRIALVVTSAGEDFSAYTGTIKAYGGWASTCGPGGAGTIYKQSAADRAGRGMVFLNNNNLGARYTDVPPSLPGNVPGEVNFAPFIITNAATLRMTTNFTVGDIWLQSANAWLNLGSNTLNVKTSVHPLTPGSVTNYGAIIWLIKGMVFKGF